MIETLNAETRAELRRLIDERRRIARLTPKKVARYKTAEEQLKQRRAQWRAYYYRNRELRCADERERYWRNKARAAQRVG